MFRDIAHRYLSVPYLLNARELSAPTKPTVTIVLLHGINSSMKMWLPIVSKLPKDARVIGIDLLGFGDSPRVSWPAYQVKIQSRCVAATLFSMRLRGPVIVVGHSLGGLVAIDFARRYPIMTRRLVLVSPPIFDVEAESQSALRHNPRKMLKEIHEAMSLQPDRVTKVVSRATQYKFLNKGFDPKLFNIAFFLGTLESAIINQTSGRDFIKIKKPTVIITGKLDPVVSKKTIQKIAKEHASISHISVVSGHEIIGLMKPVVIKAIHKAARAVAKE